MKNSIFIFSFLTLSPLSFAEEPKLRCKELDFNSYHKVQNVKSNILRTTPDRSQPNFAGKYLLLRNDFLFDTLWFVADCSTGKFIKESLSTSHKNPKAEFNVNSSTVLISSEQKENQIPPEYHVFQNEKWMRVDPPATPTPSPTLPEKPAVTASTSPASPSEPLFTQYPPTSSSSTCKELDYRSYSRAESAKKNLIENTPDRGHPNFGGHLLLLKGDTIFQNFWLIADCETGKFFREILTGSSYFEKNSRLFKIYSSGSFPTFYVWVDEDQQWMKQSGANSIKGKNAKILWDALSNSEKSSIVRFENLKCSPDHCEVDLGKEKAKAIPAPQSQALLSYLKTWSRDLQIKSGKCEQENKSVNCVFEN